MPSQPYIGDIIMVGFNFAPPGWFMCDGQTLPISQYIELFNLIGTTYGGDGVSTFALPDLRGRVPMHLGPGYVIGKTFGEENHSLLVNELPGHTHQLMAVSNPSTLNAPSGSMLGQTSGALGLAYGAPTSLQPMAPQSLGLSGGSQPHDNIQPILAVNFIIAWTGVYPSES